MAGSGEHWLEVRTTRGPIRAFFREGSVWRCELPPWPAGEGVERLETIEVFFGHCSSDAGRLSETAAKFILAALEGRPAACPPLGAVFRTDFAQACCSILRGVPAGRTLSYGELALAAGRPGGARAAGRFCAANPLPLFIPCHRVTGSGGKLGGYSGGIGWKIFLLRMEGAL